MPDIRAVQLVKYQTVIGYTANDECVVLYDGGYSEGQAVIEALGKLGITEVDSDYRHLRQEQEAATTLHREQGSRRFRFSETRR